MKYRPINRLEAINWLAVLSLLFSAGAIGACVWSRWEQDVMVVQWVRDTGDSLRTYSLTLHSTQGSAGVYVDRHDVPPVGVPRARSELANKPAIQIFWLPPQWPMIYSQMYLWKWCGFSIARPGSPGRHYDGWGGEAPDWFVAIPFAMLAFMFVRIARQTRQIQARTESGLCVSCGYDLRATRGRCPECGAVSGKTGMANEIG